MARHVLNILVEVTRLAQTVVQSEEKILSVTGTKEYMDLSVGLMACGIQHSLRRTRGHVTVSGE